MKLFTQTWITPSRSFLTKRTTPPPSNPLHRITRRQRRCKSSTSPHSEPPAGQESPTASPEPAESNVPSAPLPPPPAGSVASSAGASTPPVAATSRSLRQIIGQGPLGRLGRSYARAQERRPYATQVISSIVVYLFGDLSAQLLFPSEKPKATATRGGGGDAKSETVEDDDGGKVGYDPLRTLRHLTVGAGSSIPSYHWFMLLHNNFNFASKFLSILTKVAVQQACFTPVFNTYFFSMHSLLAGASLDETWERVKTALPVSIRNSVKLWPAVTAFSFMYVPPQFRNVFAGCIAVGWQTYLSWLNQKAAQEVQARELAEAAAPVISGIASSSPSQALQV